MTTRRPPLGRWLPVAEAADLLSCSPNHVRRLIASGALDASNIAATAGDAKWRVSERAIAEFTAARRPESAKRAAS